ncbi:MAG: DUF503 domain-containing protein [Lentisphaeria bacterium]|nr:DUF503 domain-containing protein [Lentisphaeria bacterium]
MIVGILTLEIDIDGAYSLKEKRMTVNRIRDRVRKTFNVSIAEVDDNEVWNHACMGVVTVSNDQRHANEMLSKVLDFVAKIRDCELEDYTMEFL